MYIRRLIYSDVGRYIISILLGLGLATLFRQVCKDRECLVFHAAPMDKIREQIFKYQNKCYTFKENAQSCATDKKILDFA